MIALCVDDEMLLLRHLKRTVSKSPDISKAVAFDDELDALAWARKNPFDIAFLDIELHSMNGLTLATRLKEIQPDISVVFCTGYPQYAVEVLGLHMDSGYLVKPIEYEDVQKEIDHIRLLHPDRRYLLKVRADENAYEFYGSNGQRLYFKRTRARELLALLIRQEGVSLSAKDLCARIFEEEGELDKKNANYFYKLHAELCRVLEEAGSRDVLKKNGMYYYVDMDRVKLEGISSGAALP